MSPVPPGPPLGAAAVTALGQATARLLVDPVLAVVFPSACPGCGGDVDRPTRGPLCDACWATLPRHRGPLCACGFPLPPAPPDPAAAAAAASAPFAAGPASVPTRARCACSCTS